MNIIGLIVPKIISILTIWIPPIGIKSKIILSALWLIKLIVDYDIARPGHSGNIYKLTKKMNFEVGEFIVSCIQFFPAMTFLLATVVMEAWIPAIPVIVVVFIYFTSIIWHIKDAIMEKKRRGNKNTNLNNMK